MFAARRHNPVLTSTDADHLVSEHDGVITVDRRLGNTRSRFVMNYSDAETVVSLDDNWSVAVFTGTTGPLDRTDNGWLLGQWSAALFLNDRSQG
jgi:hypothetical protein